MILVQRSSKIINANIGLLEASRGTVVRLLRAEAAECYTDDNLYH